MVVDDPDACRHRVGRDDRPRLREDGPDPLDEPAGLVFGARRPDQDHELVAAEAGDEVAGAHDSSEPRRDLDEHRVADLVTERVVDVLEVVEIDEGQDRGLSCRAGTFERLGERGPIEQLRE